MRFGVVAVPLILRFSRGWGQTSVQLLRVSIPEEAGVRTGCNGASSPMLVPLLVLVSGPGMLFYSVGRVCFVPVENGH